MTRVEPSVISVDSNARSAGLAFNGFGATTHCRIRRAESDDAPAISERYRRSYSSCDGRKPTDNYPYPQVMDRQWVGEALANGSICWLVAELFDGRPVGAIAAHLRVGTAADRIAEYFGLVVDPEFRANGFATRLLLQLCRALRATVDVGLGEMRTADPQAARVLPNSPMRPLGFEPFVHTMLAGSESMIVVGTISKTALERRARTGRSTPAVARLAACVLEPFGIRPLAIASPEDTCGAVSVKNTHLTTPMCGSTPHLVEVSARLGANFLCMLHRSSAEKLTIPDIHRLKPITRNGVRSDERYFVVRSRNQNIASVRISQDRHDARVRVLALEGRRAEYQEAALRLVLQKVEREATSGPVVVSCLIHAVDLCLERTLETLEFRPNVYYPALLACNGARGDAVQYIRVIGRPIKDSAEFLNSLTWRQGRKVVEHIISTFPPRETDWDNRDIELRGVRYSGRNGLISVL